MGYDLFQITQNDLISAVLEIEQIMLANSGEDPFDEIIKLVLAKLYDEYTTHNDPHASSAFVDCQDAQSTMRMIRKLLQNAVQKWPALANGNTEIKLSPQHLKICIRPLLGIKLFHENLAVLDAAFEHLLTRTAKGSMGQYFTPRHVVDMCVRMLNPTVDELILDPACGSGGFLLHAWQHARHSRRQTKTGGWFGFDLDSRAVRIAEILSILGAHSELNVLRRNSLDGSDWSASRVPSIIGEFRPLSLTAKHKEGWELLDSLQVDVILTNPPFAGDISDSSILSHYELSYRRSGQRTVRGVDRDVLFIERCVRALRPGGRLAIVVPQGILCNENTRYVREWLFDHCRILGSVGLDPFTFLPHTGTKTSVLFIQKNDSRGLDYPIFFAMSDRPGKNSAGEFLYKGDSGGGQALDHDLFWVSSAWSAFATQEKLGFAFDDSEAVGATEEWKNTHVNVVQARDVRKSGRLDAEFFDPRVLGLEEDLRVRSSSTIGAKVTNRLQRFRQRASGTIRYFDISSVDPDTGIATPDNLSVEDAPSRAQYLVIPGDVLVSTVRPNRNGVTLVRPMDGPLVASSGFCVLRPRGVSPEFLFAYCKTGTFRRLLSRHASASMYPAVSNEDVLSLPFVDPDPQIAQSVEGKVKAAFNKMEEARKLLNEAVELVESSLTGRSKPVATKANSRRHL